MAAKGQSAVTLATESNTRPIGPRSLSRGIFRGYVLELERQGELAALRPRLSAATLNLIASGNLAPRWIDGSIIDELLCTVAAQAGRQAARTLGHSAMRNGVVGKVLEPLLSVVLLRSGNPGALFSRADGMASIVSQGTSLSWASAGTGIGTLTLRCDEPCPEPSWAAWEGALSYAFDLIGTPGRINQARILDEGRCCEMKVTWGSP
jgi:hypothetical protein